MGESSESTIPALTLVTFGFKYGAPDDCCMVFDVRVLRNPFWVPELRDFDGNTQAVKDYVFDDPNTAPLCRKLADLILFTLPLYRPDPDRHTVVGIGCTGGRHRSVAVANELAQIISERGYSVETAHRDIDKDTAGSSGEEP